MPPTSLQLNLLLSAPSFLTHEGSLAPESSLCLLISTTNHSLVSTKAQRSSWYKGDIYYSNAFRETTEGRFISPIEGKRKSILVTATWGNRCDSHISADNREQGGGNRRCCCCEQWLSDSMLNISNCTSWPSALTSRFISFFLLIYLLVLLTCTIIYIQPSNLVNNRVFAHPNACHIDGR